MKNKIVNIVIVISLIFAAFFAAKIPTMWTGFALSSAIMLGAILLQRRERKALFADSQSDALTLNDFFSSLLKVKEKLEEYSKAPTEYFTKQVEDDLEDILPEVDNYKMGIIENIGVEKYTEIITTYANGERLINRGVSAAIDQYSAAAKEYFNSALPIVNETIKIINKIK
ncbi:MAG: hypothetical protein GXO87_05170 [Chlorobi bacterium]|nr:hypothetical protein [Chlorobiota bacterium]